MREITIGNQTFEIRGLRLSEVSSSKMKKLGYGRFAFRPEIGPEGDERLERLADVMDAALLAVLGKDGYERIDQAGGVSGLQAAWQAIMAETYGVPGAEKNSSAAGSGSATPGGSTTAAPAENQATGAPAASTGIPPS
jgi:hypothetical protein